MAGVRGLLAPWIGGASAGPVAATPAGVRSLLAFWIGGASSIAPTAPEPAVVVGRHRPAVDGLPSWSPAYLPARRRVEEDEAILMICN